jgi:hypothetical protein
MIGPEGRIFQPRPEEGRAKVDPLVGLTPDQLQLRQELVNLLKKSPPHAVDLSRYIRDLLTSEEEGFYNDFINRTVNGEEVSLEDRKRFLSICYKLGLVPDKTEYDKRLQLIEQKYRLKSEPETTSKQPEGLSPQTTTELKIPEAESLLPQGFSLEVQHRDEKSLLEKISTDYNNANSELRMALQRYGEASKDSFVSPEQLRDLGKSISDLIYETITSGGTLKIEEEEEFNNYRRRFNEIIIKTREEIYQYARKKAQENNLEVAKVCRRATDRGFVGFEFYDVSNTDEYKNSHYFDKIYLSVKLDRIPEVLEYLCKRIIDEEIPCFVKTIFMSESWMVYADPLGREQYRKEDIHALSRLDNMVIHIPERLNVEHRKKLFGILREINDKYRESLYDVLLPLARHLLDQDGKLIKGIGLGRDRKRGNSYHWVLSEIISNYLLECYEKNVVPDPEEIRKRIENEWKSLGLVA